MIVNALLSALSTDKLLQLLLNELGTCFDFSIKLTKAGVSSQSEHDSAITIHENRRTVASRINRSGYYQHPGRME